MKLQYRSILLVVILLLVVGSIFFLEARKPMRASVDGAGEIELVIADDVKKEKSTKYEVAKEITTPDGFINVDNISIKELIGKQVILVDFWTYSCINCQRTFPFLNEWHKKYGDKGLTIIGIHTPEFEFEKDFDNVLDATERFNLEFPVVLDNDFSTWRSYNNRYWPRKYLIDIDGFIVYDHIGEGAYEETEERIVEALNERNKRLGLTPVSNESIGKVELEDLKRIPRTPETYLGSSRIEFLRNLPAPECLSGTCEYHAIGALELNTYQLSGLWETGPESITVKRGGGSIIIGFSANTVNLVASTENGAVEAEIFIDGEPISEAAFGRDVTNGVVSFDKDRLYNLVDLKGNHGDHLLEIRFLEPGTSAFAFTFG